MKRPSLVLPMAVTIVVFAAPPSYAQVSTWTDCVSRQDFFSANFPGEPIVEEFGYLTEYRITLPARVYRHESGLHRHSATVVDYTDALAIHQARADDCRASGGDGDLCHNAGRGELRGAIVYASWNILNRDGADISHFAYHNTDLVEGHAIHLTNADGSRTSAVVHMHEDRLYILESTVPPGAPAPGIFQISLQFYDSEFKPVRYARIYSNEYPPPPRVPVYTNGYPPPPGSQ